MPGLSLWLSPPPSSPIYNALESLITQISDDLFGGAAPNFSPHITLTSDIPLDADPAAVVKYAASTIEEKLEIDVTHVAYGPSYFKKIYLRVTKTPELVRLAGESRRKYAYTAVEDAEVTAREWEVHEYDPHISLVYSDEWPIHKDKKIDIEARLETLFGEVGKTWLGGRISLVKTIGPADKWPVLAYKDL
ncbi:2',3'-cyclic-nucleotide 3'-phosphodiesterase [Lipomyces chichibuensis]|uniref:2',3'-cyclic-nucleotide 3'-phosphodiesterase n=1 Tax=Lipomyces chichibuensis TaxID=1546026 RepID=UPI0033432E75